MRTRTTVTSSSNRSAFGMMKFFLTERAVVQAIRDSVSASRGIQPT